MINVFCTRKLETFIKVKKKDESFVESSESWICHLIPIGGKKSLYFIDTKTLYSVLLINVQKKDLQNIEQMFVSEIVNQLKNDGILKPEKELLVRNKYKSLTFNETNNDQKTLGTLRDNIAHLKSYIYDKSDKQNSAREFTKESINRIPLGSRKYSYAKELMAEELKDL